MALQAQHHVNHLSQFRLVINCQHAPRSSRRLRHGNLGARRGSGPLRSGERQAERCAAIRTRVKAKLTAVASHDARYLGQAEPCAVVALGREEWFENARLKFRRDAGARVADLSLDAIPHSRGA